MKIWTNTIFAVSMLGAFAFWSMDADTWARATLTTLCCLMALVCCAVNVAFEATEEADEHENNSI